MGASCCGNETRFEGLDPAYKRRLWVVIGMNAVMFLVEMGAGALAGSRALLQAYVFYFLGDTLTYGMTLAVIGWALRVRAWAAFIKGVIFHPDGSVGPRCNGVPRTSCRDSPGRSNGPGRLSSPCC